MALQTVYIESILKNHLKSEDYQIISCENYKPDNLLPGFLSVQEYARINYKQPKLFESELCVFIKRLPESQYHRENILSLGVFHREVVLYNEILNHYREILGEDIIPKCYLATSDDIVVLEDMGKKGFKNKKVYQTFNLRECEVTLESLAKFHALSFLTEKNEGCKMSELLPVLMNAGLMGDEKNIGRKKVIMTGIRAFSRVVEHYLPHYPEAVVKKAFDLLSKQMKLSKICPKVLTHSDLWANNVMLKYNLSGVAEKACLVDFQLATYEAPTYDILFFMHTSTDNAFRAKHQNHLMEYYFKVLSQQLSSFRMDIKDILSRSDFESMLEKTLPLVLGLTCFAQHFCLLPEEIWQEVMSSDSKYQYFYEQDRTKEVLEGLKSSQTYRDRLLQALTNLLGYFASGQQ